MTDAMASINLDRVNSLAEEINESLQEIRATMAELNASAEEE